VHSAVGRGGGAADPHEEPLELLGALRHRGVVVPAQEEPGHACTTRRERERERERERASIPPLSAPVLELLVRMGHVDDAQRVPLLRVRESAIYRLEDASRRHLSAPSSRSACEAYVSHVA